MRLTKKPAAWGLIVAGLGALGFLGAALWPAPDRREFKDLDLSLGYFAFESGDLGGGYGRYAFPVQSRETAVTGGGQTAWQSRGRALVKDRALLLPYAGFGLGPFALSMDLRELDLWLLKDLSTRRSRAFLGIGYTPLPNLDLNLEYRALANGGSLFALDLGNLSLDLDNPFGVQTVALTVDYWL